MRTACLAWLLVALVPGSGIAASPTYRCDAGGAITYSDKPCTAGRQIAVDVAMEGPNAADRTAAAQRLRDDKATIEAIERERLERNRRTFGPDRRVRRPPKPPHACDKLALRVARAREDLQSAPQPQQESKRVKVRRAEEDYASCKSQA